MSQIFDALQRAEVERSGASGQTQLQATEVLARAEQLAKTEWERADSNVELRDVPASHGASSALKAVLGGALPQDRVLGSSGPATTRALDAIEPVKANLPEDSRLVCITDKQSPSAEAFRLLGVRLRDMRQGRMLQKILVTSTIPQEGKSTVAANLACSLAESGKERVLLLEGDVRRPSQSKLFGLQPRPGICEWLQGDVELSKCMCYIEDPGLWILPAGAVARNPLELLKLSRVSALMQQLEELFGTIVIDSPPVLPLADTSVWTRIADGILLVTREGITEKKQLIRGIESVEKDKFIGVLLNSSCRMMNSHYYYG